MLRLSLCSGTCLSATSSGTSSLHRRSLFVGQAASRPGTGFGVPSSDPFTGKSKLFQARLAVTAVPAGTILAGAADLLPPSAQLQGKAVKAKWNAVSLAFLGDSVWELYVRRCFFFPPRRTSEYYEKVVYEVRAESQERHLEQLLAGPVLSDEEKDVIRWGNNAKISIPRRFGKSGSHAKTYRAATAMECLIGFLYLTDMQRLQELMTYLGFGVKPTVSTSTPAAVDDVPMQVAS